MSKKDLSGLFVNNVKIPRHDRDLLVSYMKLLDIAGIDYTVDATNNEYNLSLHELTVNPPLVSKGSVQVGTIKTDTIRVGDPYPFGEGGSISTTPIPNEKLKSVYDEVTSLNENVAKAISNIDKLAIDSAVIKGIGLTSAKIKNLTDIPLTTATLANAKDIAKVSDEGRGK